MAGIASKRVACSRWRNRRGSVFIASGNPKTLTGRKISGAENRVDRKSGTFIAF
jgi:hypothetical protein